MRAMLSALVLALAACSSGAREEMPPPQLPQRAGTDPIVAARAAGVDFQATGVSPDFLLQMFTDAITLTRGADAVTFPRPEPRYPAWDGEIYETINAAHRLRIEIRHYPCDAANGERLPARVTIRIDGQELSGCGRSLPS